MAMFTSSISKPSVSAGVALKSLSVVAIATLGLFAAPAAQAAIISGQVSGTWDYASGGFFNLGDAFTADYTYDSASITTTDFDYVYYDRSLYSVVPLLSLVLKSGDNTHVFSLDNISGSGSISWYDFFAPELYGEGTGDYVYKHTFVSASGYLDSVGGYFTSDVQTGQYYDGAPFSGSSAYAYQYGQTNGGYFTDGWTHSGVSISDTTAVPTPALLPGLIGMGVGVLRRRKQAKAETVAV